MKKCLWIATALFVCGFVCVVAGVCLLFYFDYLIKKKIIENASIRYGSQTFKKWADEPDEIYIDFYFFNVTNAADVMSTNFTPEVSQIGPYVYREMRKKVHIEFSENNASVSYKQQNTYIFDSSLSPGLSEKDQFYTLNLPIIVISKFLEDKFRHFVLDAIRLLLKSEKLFEKRAVNEILWGYNATVAIEINYILKWFHLPEIHFPEFGLYVGKRANGSLSEMFNISTGISDISDLGRIYSWNNCGELPFWSGKMCNMINGTDGTFWHPFVNKSNKLYLYNPEVCRSFDILYNSTEELLSISVYKFVIPPSAFKDFSKVPYLQCFCVPNVQSCLKRGVLDISACNGGAPIIISLPHFLYSDEEYINALHGILPDRSKHETFISIEPYTGKALEAHKRLQVNLLLRKYEVFDATKHLKKPIIFPISWADEHGMLTRRDANELHTELFDKIMMTNCIKYGLIVLGCIFILTSVVIFICEIKHNLHKMNPEAKSQEGDTSTLISDDINETN